MAGNDAEGKAPTIEEEMAKFQGFSVKDGEVDKGEPTEAEKAALIANQSSHNDNVKRGSAPAEKKEGEKPAPKAVELTDDESEAAIAAAEEAAGAELTEDEKDAAVAAALEEKTKEQKTQRDKTAKGRISTLTRDKRTAERRADALNTENAALRAQLAGGKPADKSADLTKEGKSERKELPGKPDPSDAKKYEYGELDAKYIADLTRWTVLDAQDEAKQSETSTRQSAADEAAGAAFKERVSAFEEAGLEKFGDDFQEVIESLELPKNDPYFWPLSPALGELLLESEVGPDIAKELASNPKEARRIHAMSPLRQATWFGVKEAELLANSGAGSEEDEEGEAPAGTKKPILKTPAPKESKAPRPLENSRKLNGAGGNRIPDGATSDFAAFEAQARSIRR